MKAKDWLDQAKQKLSENNIATWRLDSLILLEDNTTKDRAWLLANPDYDISDEKLNILNSQLKRRSKHEPLAYIRQKSEFYGRTFKVTPDTLQPRPETETMIELFIKNKSDTKRVIDVGTGSGAIAITVKLECPELELNATELNKQAISVAEENAKILDADINFYKGNLLHPIPTTIYQQPTTIIANLPYVPDSHTINESAMQEPAMAIFGGKDGLDLYRQMFNQIDDLENKPVTILTESLPFQHQELESVAADSKYKLTVVQDLIQVFSLRV